MSTEREPDGRWRMLDRGVRGAKSADPSVARRVRALQLALAVMILLSLPIAVQFAMFGMLSMVAAVLLSTLFCSGAMLALQRGHSPARYGYLTGAVMFLLVLAVNLTHGGFLHPNFAWFYIIPLLGALIVDMRAAWWGGLLVALTTVAFWLRPELGLRVPDQASEALLSAHALFSRLLVLFAILLLVSVFVSVHKRDEQRIRELAFNDALTGLPNRRALQERLEALSTDGDTAAGTLLFVDLDRFKSINDSLGHAVGDDLLREVAARLGGLATRYPDLFVARFGGDEFALLWLGTENEADVVELARSILDALRRPIQAQGFELFPGASVGIARYPTDMDNRDDLLRLADVAMYAAKARGGGHYAFCTREQVTRAERRHHLERALRQALERQELQVFFQPVLAARSGRIVAGEALVRWESPEYGTVSPEEFIPIAEVTGLIVPLGEQVLYTACAQLRSWLDNGMPPVRLCVNISPHQLRSPVFIHQVSTAMEAFDLDASLIELEITESVLVEDDEIIHRAIQGLTEAGVGLSLDDFGTGYSSLSYLQRFTFDRVKIDRRFIAGVPDNLQDAALTRSVVTMARGLSLAVVAEGVENAAQMEFLCNLGCDELQGYHIARPLSAAAFAARLAGAADAPHPQQPPG